MSDGVLCKLDLFFFCSEGDPPNFPPGELRTVAVVLLYATSTGSSLLCIVLAAPNFARQPLQLQPISNSKLIPTHTKKVDEVLYVVKCATIVTNL